MKNRNIALILATVAVLALSASLFGVYRYFNSNSVVNRVARRYNDDG